MKVAKNLLHCIFVTAKNVKSSQAGSLDEPVDVSNAIHVWVGSKLPGVIIPTGAKQYLRENM